MIKIFIEFLNRYSSTSLNLRYILHSRMIFHVNTYLNRQKYRIKTIFERNRYVKLKYGIVIYTNHPEHNFNYFVM